VEWVIDTNVLVDADNVGNDALDFMVQVKHRHQLVLDYEGEIRNEYQKQIMARKIAPNGFVIKWLKYMNGRSDKIVFYSKTVRKQYAQKYLINKLNFDSNDLKFVGVASRSKDKCLVTEDCSDYDADVKDYLLSKLDITVFDTSGALTKVLE